MSLCSKNYEAVVILGGQLIRKEDRSIGLAFHTEMRARAGGLACRSGMTSKLIISGGHNVGVRYSLKENRIFPKPNYSPLALILARRYPSEAKVIADFARRNYGVQRSCMMLEEDSTSTEENARNCVRIVGRLGLKKTALLTSFYHMSGACACFVKEGLDPELLYAEDLLILEDQEWVSKIAEYYSQPRGGRKWDVEKIRSNLQRGESIATGLT